MIHWSSLVVAPRSFTSVGRATLTMVPSTTMRNTDRHSTPRMSQRRSWAAGGAGSVALVACMSSLLVSPGR